MMDHGDHGSFGWMMAGGMMFMWVFWIGLIVLVMWGVGSLRWRERPSAIDETPLEILRRRYANGQIDEVEFDRIRKVLGTGESPATNQE